MTNMTPHLPVSLISSALVFLLEKPRFFDLSSRPGKPSIVCLDSSRFFGVSHARRWHRRSLGCRLRRPLCQRCQPLEQ